MIKRVLVFTGLLAVFGAGFGLAYSLLRKSPAPETTIQNSTVLLNRVEEVCKLVTVEGHFSELYDETNIRRFTVYVPMPSTFSFSKKAILQVEGKVLVGYDLKNIKITADSTQKRVVLSHIPEPEILSVDHTIAYKNLSESFFNSFAPEDYTRLNANAKAMLREKAKGSDLMQEARLEGNQLIRIMDFIVRSAGWSLFIQTPGSNVPLPADSLLT
ncbi:DUF4230 domain-containing protein [Phaeodactylibacter xiamenensis]|uniref:DUF4230 domain-containing protein n=1 Tax=Phaeodactylibacter xiamenensis TaxID=1524460 RepID=UPI0024A8EE8E|nr:DUF4230 domain-containing protein [Phaeodactylibacter xiamenensis]